MRFSAFNRFSAIGTSSFTKPVLIFSFVILIPALIFNSLIISGCTTTAPTSRRFYLVQFQYNTTSGFYKSLQHANNASTSTNAPKLRRADQGPLETTFISISTTSSTSRPASHTHTPTVASTTMASSSPSPSPSSSSSSSPPAPAQSHPTGPALSQIRISHRGICIESSTDSWTCTTSLETANNEAQTITNDPSGLISISTLYLSKIAWETPIWITLSTLLLSIILIIINLLPIPITIPFWTRKLLLAFLAISSTSILGSMILSTTTSQAVATLVTTITQNAIEVHIGRADIIFGWFLFALLLVCLLGVTGIVAAEWTMNKAKETVLNKTNEFVEKVGGGGGSSLSSGSLRSRNEKNESGGHVEETEEDMTRRIRQQALKIARGKVEAKLGDGGRAGAPSANPLGLILPGSKR